MVRALVLFALLTVGGVAGAATISLNVANPSGVPLKSYPLTTGVPLAEGVLASDQQVALHDEQGREIPLQAACTSKHADGSVRWLLLDFQADIPVVLGIILEKVTGSRAVFWNLGVGGGHNRTVKRCFERFFGGRVPENARYFRKNLHVFGGRRRLARPVFTVRYFGKNDMGRTGKLDCS